MLSRPIEPTVTIARWLISIPLRSRGPASRCDLSFLCKTSSNVYHIRPLHITTLTSANRLTRQEGLRSYRDEPSFRLFRSAWQPCRLLVTCRMRQLQLDANCRDMVYHDLDISTRGSHFSSVNYAALFCCSPPYLQHYSRYTAGGEERHAPARGHRLQGLLAIPLATNINTPIISILQQRRSVTSSQCCPSLFSRRPSSRSFRRLSPHGHRTSLLEMDRNF